MTLLERDREKIEEGRLEGKINTLIKLLKKKFKDFPEEYIQKLSKSTDETLDKIAEDIFDIENINDLDKYF